MSSTAAASSSKRRKTEQHYASETDAIRADQVKLNERILSERVHYYASDKARSVATEVMPHMGQPAAFCKEIIRDYSVLDFKPRLNTSSYVNVTFEPEELEVAELGMSVNLADQTVYPQSFKMHNDVLNWIGGLWNCPKPPDFDDYGCFAGAGTVGSTEACLLAGLAFKFRWRKWFAARHGMDENSVRGVYPNLVISTQFQACWEKLFKYMDIEPHFVTPLVGTFKVTPESVRAAIDEKTIGVVCILGNHYGGQYDPVQAVSDMLDELNAERGFQVGIHVDGASGGFIAPFQKECDPFDFRVSNVLSMSASGHKFGESVCGTGWVVWRRRQDLAEHVAISVSYLGGKADSYTLNFSRPATGVYVQFYKLLRLGFDGYSRLCVNMMSNAKTIRDGLKSFTKDGKPRFTMLDDGDEGCLPVVTAMLNPELSLSYDDIDLQHALAKEHWYVCGYKMSYNHPVTEKSGPLFSDMPKDHTMFRVVVKANLTATLAEHLLKTFESTLGFLDAHGAGFQAMHADTKANQHAAGHCC